MAVHLLDTGSRPSYSVSLMPDDPALNGYGTAVNGSSFCLSISSFRSQHSFMFVFV